MPGPGAGKAGRALGTALAVMACCAGPLGADVLRVESAGQLLAAHDLPPGGGWCLRWNHSVTGGHVEDCFDSRDGRLTLARSYLHDFAAGLGTVAGRGELAPAPGGGYWIEAIDEPVPGDALILRVGQPAVAHHLRIGGKDHSLSDIAAGQRVTLRLVPGP